jgi:CRP/FNR family transcriptional regulator, cyclic AMP receptor protein
MATKQKKSFDAKVLLLEANGGRTIDQYRQNQVIFAQGDSADSIFYIQKGKVKITVVSEQGKEAIVSILETDDIFGQRCLAGQPRRTATATALTASVIVRLEKATILRAIHAQPDFAEMLIEQLLTRFIRVEADLIDQLFNSSEERLARLILLLAKFDKTEKQESVIINVTQEMLAEKIRTTRARVSFFMNKFRRLGLINYHGNIVHVQRSRLNLMLHEQSQAMD